MEAKKCQIDSWTRFLESLKVQFGLFELEDYQGKLSKLVQMGSVLEYQEAFKDLADKVDALSESFLLSCFVSGLKPQIQHEIASFQPSSLTRAMAFAKIQEHKLQSKHISPKLYSPYPPLLPT